MKKENDMSTRVVVSKIHGIQNHKRVEQIEIKYRITGNFYTLNKKLIKEVVEDC